MSIERSKCISFFLVVVVVVVVFYHSLTLKPVKFLEGELTHDLLIIPVSVNWCHMSSFIRIIDFIDSLGLSHEQNMAKMRLLTIMGIAVKNKEISWGTWMVQSVKCLTLCFCSGHGLRILGLSTTWSSELSMESGGLFP